MENILTILFIIDSLLLIVVVLLQSGKSEGASGALVGGVDLFVDRKERGAEVFMTRLTFSLGFIFCSLAIVLSIV